MPKSTFVVAIAGVLLLGGGVAFADGLGGSTEHHDVCRSKDGQESLPSEDGTCAEGSDPEPVYSGNEVTCGDNIDVGGIDLYAGERGAELCGDDDQPLPIQGRFILEVSPGRNVYRFSADGDNAVQPNDPWIGVGNWPSGDPLSCGDANGNLDADHPEAKDGIEDGHCGRANGLIQSTAPTTAAYDVVSEIWVTAVPPQG